MSTENISPISTGIRDCMGYDQTAYGNFLDRMMRRQSQIADHRSHVGSQVKYDELVGDTTEHLRDILGSTLSSGRRVDERGSILSETNLSALKIYINNWSNLMPMLQNEIARLDASIIPHTLAIQWSSGGSLDEAFLSAIESQNLIYHWEQRASGIDAEKVRSQAENAPLVSAAVWMLKR